MGVSITDTVCDLAPDATCALALLQRGRLDVGAGVIISWSRPGWTALKARENLAKLMRGGREARSLPSLAHLGQRERRGHMDGADTPRLGGTVHATARQASRKVDVLVDQKAGRTNTKVTPTVLVNVKRGGVVWEGVEDGGAGVTVKGCSILVPDCNRQVAGELVVLALDAQLLGAVRVDRKKERCGARNGQRKEGGLDEKAVGQLHRRE